MTVMESVSAISDWVRVESPSYDALGVNRMMDLVAQDVAGLAIAVERIGGRDGLGDIVVLRAGPDNGRAHVQVLSHLDTVHPLGTIEAALPLRIDGDRLYGPGVYDMKGGAWLALQAFKDSARAGLLTRPVQFVFTPDEEIGSPTSRDVLADLAMGAVASLVTEPARQGGRIVTARKGTGNFTIEIEGRAAHAGVNHEKGRSALREAANQILALEAMTDYAIGTTVSVGTLKGGTVTNVVPQYATLEVDCRVTTVEAGERLEAAIHSLRPQTPDVRITIAGGMNRPPFEKTPEITALLATAQGLAKDIGFDLQDVPMTGGGSDANFVAVRGIPALDGLGIDGDCAHTLQEHALISSIAPRRELMRRLLTTL